MSKDIQYYNTRQTITMTIRSKVLIDENKNKNIKETGKSPRNPSSSYTIRNLLEIC